MRTFSLVFLVFLSLLIPPSQGCAVAPTLAPGEEAYGQAYVFISGYDILLQEGVEEAKHYNGVQFPLYCGYIIATNKNFYFVKKTDLPITRVVKYFETIKKQGFIAPDWPYNARFNPIDFQFRLIGSPYFFNTLLQKMKHSPLPFDYLSAEGLPDDDYAPQFEETCIYNSLATPPQECSSLSFIDYLIIPTANEYISREDKDEQRKLRFRLLYDKKRKVWNDRRYMKYMKDGSLRAIHEVLNSHTGLWDIRYIVGKDNISRVYERLDPATSTWVPMPKKEWQRRDSYDESLGKYTDELLNPETGLWDIRYYRAGPIDVDVYDKLDPVTNTWVPMSVEEEDALQKKFFSTEDKSKETGKKETP